VSLDLRLRRGFMRRVDLHEPERAAGHDRHQQQRQQPHDQAGDSGQEVWH
jgi:hypothetical protein